MIFRRILRELAAIRATQQLILAHITMEEEAMSALDDLKAEVEKNVSLESSAVALMQGLASQLQAAISNNDAAALQDLTNQLNASATTLAAAITANTPAAPPAAAASATDSSAAAPATDSSAAAPATDSSAAPATGQTASGG